MALKAKKQVKKQDVKIENKPKTIDKTMFWKAVADGANAYKKQDNQSGLVGSIRNHFRDPYALDIVKDGNSFAIKQVKASVIYDNAMLKDERYTFNDSVTNYNPYLNSPMTLPPANYFNNLNSLIINNFFVGYGELSLIAQNPIISNICQIRSHEVIGKWIKISSTGETDHTDKIKKLNTWFKEKKVKELFKQAIHWSFQFGGCMIYHKLKGDENEDNGLVERAKPLMIDKLQIGRGDVESLILIEPNWYTAINWQSFDPLKTDFYKPQKYTILGRLTHATRVMHFKYKEVPDILKPTYMFNGQPLAQELLPYLMGFEQSRNNINMLIAKYNHFVLGTDLKKLLPEQSDLIDAGQNLGMRIAIFNQVASANNVVAIDKNTETFENISLNLSGVSDVMNQNISYVCSIARIPITKLFQNSLNGMNPTGEFETNSFYDTIREDRANIVDPHLDTIFKLAQLDLFGEIYEDISYEWEPLEEANELELSQIRLNKAQESVQYVTSGILHPLNVAKKLQTDKESGWDGLEINESDYETDLSQHEDIENEKDE